MRQALLASLLSALLSMERSSPFGPMNRAADVRTWVPHAFKFEATEPSPTSMKRTRSKLSMTISIWSQARASPVTIRDEP